MKAGMLASVALGGAAAVMGSGAAAIGWLIARRLTAPVRGRTFSLVVRDIEYGSNGLVVVLDRKRDTAATGIYNIWLERGGWAQLGEQVTARGVDRVARRVTRASQGLELRVGDSASWSGIYFATPEDAELETAEVSIDTPAGAAPAWLIDTGGPTWAIHVHGLGSPRAGTLRGVQVASGLGYTALVVTYRNDGDGSTVGPGRSTLGWAESDDVEAALRFEHGAERIVLFGWSLGAAIAFNLARTSRHASRISGLVLDSPCA